MLVADPVVLDADTVASASTWSILKSATTTVAGIALLAGGLLALVRRRRR
jgi:LPXTG-motif cell wall-anchored protein